MMEYTKRVGRAAFRADVTHGERGGWSIRAGAFRATLPLSRDEADDWVAAGRPSEPADLPERVVSFLGDVARVSSSPRRSETTRVKCDREKFAPLDGEEDIRVGQVEYLAGERFGERGEAVSGVVRCYSPRHEGGNALWFVIAKPGSTFDRVPKYCDGAGRVENVTPHDFAEQHREWHREQYGVSTRVELDRWIERHKGVQIPELGEAERREIDLGIALAKSER